MNIFLVRHGHTELRGRRGNPNLSDLGNLQAQRLGEWIAQQDFQFAAFYSSDLIRSAETSDKLEACLGMPYQFEPRLRESGGWRADGIPYDLSDPSEPHPPETWINFSTRILDLWETLAADYTGQTILCMSHGGVFDVMMGQIMRVGSSPHVVTLTYHTAFSEFHYDLTAERVSRRLNLIQYNQIPHLPDAIWQTA